MSPSVKPLYNINKSELSGAHFYTPVQWLTVNSACNAEAPEDSVSQGLIEGWAQSFKFCPQRVLGQSILPRSLYSGSEEKERDEAADISLLLAAVEYPPTEYSITFLGALTSHCRFSTLPNNCLRTFSRLSLCIYMYTALSAPSSVFCYLAWTTATQPLSKSASWTSSPAQVQFRWSQYLVMTGNWWQTWDVELGPEGSRVTPLSLPCPDLRSPHSNV